MKPYVVCCMASSIDGKLHSSRFTGSPEGNKADWSAAYEEIHDKRKADAGIVSRVTMAWMTGDNDHNSRGTMGKSRTTIS
jgi:riboflavin biosynthesis pyrimidine reductase